MTMPSDKHRVRGSSDQGPPTIAAADGAKAAARQRPQPPAWRQAFNQAEVFVGRPLESLTNSPEAASILIVTGRLSRKVFRQVDAVASWGLHQLHLPSHRDLRELQRQMSAIQRQLSDVRAALDESARSTDGTRP